MLDICLKYVRFLQRRSLFCLNESLENNFLPNTNVFDLLRLLQMNRSFSKHKFCLENICKCRDSLNMNYDAQSVQVRLIVTGLGINVIFFCKRVLVSLVMASLEVSLVSRGF